MKTYLVRGVPASIQQDSWWMDGIEPRRPARPARHSTGPVALAPVFLAVAILGVSLTLSPGTCPAPTGPGEAERLEWGFRDGPLLRSLPAIRTQPVHI